MTAHVLKLRSGNSELHRAFTGALAELTVNTDTMDLMLHDGVTRGGLALAKKDLSGMPAKDGNGSPLQLTDADIGRDFKLRWNGKGFDIIPLEA